MIMDVQQVSTLKARMPSVLRGLKESRNPVLVVSNGKPQAVLQDVASYQGTQDAIALLKMMLQSERSVTAQRGSSTKEVVARLRLRVAARTAMP
jgi:prevent-host-death family protein